MLNGPEILRYEENVKLCGFDPFVLKKSDFLEDMAASRVYKHCKLSSSANVMGYKRANKGLQKARGIQLFCLWIGEGSVCQKYLSK